MVVRGVVAFGARCNDSDSLFSVTYLIDSIHNTVAVGILRTSQDTVIVYR
jgi:hypothetical protein